ncbi:GNAT family N-acetyltransferase [Amorphoplanes nipponensis]|uniref:N-acetyltransferase n=1 Tax=Actinoplanes nipponensis TaxID=135950 RepID=A0A919JRW9_9ACTN|nr:GNAT family N-acetyltransferase [Actinoplanes nipponensis]GIE51864.1 N-acetyltransferase [Actinoplanes nipponensis]
MTVDLRPITAENFAAVIKLDVRPEQSTFVAPNVRGIAETHILPDAEPRAVYAGDDLVGFVLFHPVDRDRPAAGHMIVRLMIAHQFQGRGLGRQALEAAVDWIARERGADRVRLSVVPSNETARGLYRSAGFVETGELDEGEIVMVRSLRQHPPNTEDLPVRAAG